MAETSNLKLYVTPSIDNTTSLQSWFHNMAASDKESNMIKIDTAYEHLQSEIYEIQDTINELQNDGIDSSIHIDETLSISGTAADAKVTGDKINECIEAHDNIVFSANDYTDAQITSSLGEIERVLIDINGEKSDDAATEIVDSLLDDDQLFIIRDGNLLNTSIHVLREYMLGDINTALEAILNNKVDTDLTEIAELVGGDA